MAKPTGFPKALGRHIRRCSSVRSGDSMLSHWILGGKVASAAFCVAMGRPYSRQSVDERRELFRPTVDLLVFQSHRGQQIREQAAVDARQDSALFWTAIGKGHSAPRVGSPMMVALRHSWCLCGGEG